MRRGSLTGAVVIAIGLVAAAIAFGILTSLLDSADSTTDTRLQRIEDALAAADRERTGLVEGLATAQAEIARLREDLSLVANGNATTSRASERAPETAPETAPEGNSLPTASDTDASGNLEAPSETVEPTEPVNVSKDRFNRGITSPGNSVLIDLLGRPRENLSSDCQEVTNSRLASLLKTREIGPIRATMLRPALDSLERVLDRFKQSDPDLYAKLGTAGGLCPRFVRGSTTRISNHSWGTAIDLTLEGVTDNMGDDDTQFGLVPLAEYFNEEGWFWGAGYQSREDSMHFEVGEETLRDWAAQGEFD
ncbi:(acyl-carrier-protein) S-malonyltransferase [Rubellimicrobium mesophilum DSM 19309]|uniref:(Acyl-carrier-protein) S-malonyltransferase n=1 Tax=Rubellimicrobium mesophilum DSM 19309 TaxID=442562 RepID=A0A017HSH7_9RHOB|nr:M15 family metallopeptidase [Rubellimicrobium mesophilum]EYD77447.1 (acyl-carrier-protein) S-malonyltransferase [Rubellimicrobium mesophilum DSM 19309]